MAGLVLGSLLGFTLGLGRLFNWWLSDPVAATGLLCGSALLCAGQASLRGDRFWFGRGLRLASPADRIRHSKISRNASILISCVGAVSVPGAFVWHFFVR
jgi:hypothetical protein